MAHPSWPRQFQILLCQAIHPISRITNSANTIINNSLSSPCRGSPLPTTASHTVAELAEPLARLGLSHPAMFKYCFILALPERAGAQRTFPQHA